MSYFIIIRGPLGIGKTTISKKLAKILNAEYISFDKVLKENGLDRADDNYTAEDFIKAKDLTLPKVKRDLANGKIVIFDGCFYFKEQIEHLEKSLKVKGQAFNLKASVEVCIKRDSQRKIVYGENAARAVFNLVSRFDYGTNVDTDGKTEDEVVDEIVSHLLKK